MIAGAGVGLRVKLGIDPKSGLRKPKVAEPSTFGVSLPYTIASLEAESLSSLLEVLELCRRFF